MCIRDSPNYETGKILKMNLYLQFALRYFKGGKKSSFSSNAISLAVFGLAIGVFSLILTMSIIKGFEEVLASKISNIDGQIRIKTVFGKPINESDRLDSMLLASNLEIEVNPFVRGMLVVHKGNNTEGLLVEGIESFSNPSFLNLKDSETLASTNSTTYSMKFCRLSALFRKITGTSQSQRLSHQNRCNSAKFR